MAMPPGTDPLSVGYWIPDGRDEFISWIRGEFAAANAIIDTLCQHLIAIGDQNEYETIISTIQQRQASWFEVLYMQQFYSIGDISYSLQQAAWKRQQQGRPQQHHQRHYYSSNHFGVRRSGSGFNKHHHHHGGGGYESMVRNNSETKVASDNKALSVAEEKIDGNEKPKSGCKDMEESEFAPEEIVNHDCNSVSKDNNLSSEQNQDEKDKECPASMAKNFVVEEMYEAKLFNVVEGLKLYEKMVDVNEVSQLVSLANNLRNAGRRGQLQNGRRIEPIPSFLSNIIERLVSDQIIPVKPDACIIDFFNEGDHSQLHMFVPWFGRPVGILSLSECDFTFGRVIVSDHPEGDYKGSLKLSLTPGCLLLVEGNSADLAKFAIHSTWKQRILITFTKPQPRNSIDGSNWAPPPSRSPPNHHNRHLAGLPNNAAVQPIFKAPSSPLASLMPFPSDFIPVATSWPLPPQPRVPVSGTGVFLPPGSSQELGSTKKSNNNNESNSAEGKMEVKTKEEACNRSTAAAKKGDGNSLDR